MKEFSIPMALVDYIPVILFELSAVTIGRDLKERMSKGAWLTFMSGTGMVTAAGFLKATYKLLYALGVGDFAWMSDQFFSNQSLGFLLAGIGLMMYILKKGSRAYGFLPTMALVGIMVVGLGAMDAGLCFLASRMKKRNALVCIIVSFFLALSMGYLSTKDFSQAYMNWIAQLINVIGEALLHTGVSIMHKAGLKDLSL